MGFCCRPTGRCVRGSPRLFEAVHTVHPALGAGREAASLRSVNLLAQAAAHEINNPLAIIMGYVQMLEDRLPPGGEESGWAHTCKNATTPSCRSSPNTAWT